MQRRAKQTSPRARLRHFQMGNEIARSGFTGGARSRIRESVTYEGVTLGHERGEENPSISIGSRRDAPIREFRYSAQTSRFKTNTIGRVTVPTPSWYYSFYKFLPGVFSIYDRRDRISTEREREREKERERERERVILRGRKLRTGNREIGMRFASAVAINRNARRPPRNSRQDWRFSC